MLVTAIAALAATGLAIAAYFTAVTYRWMRPDARFVPPVCRMESQTCRRIVETPEARVFGLPNSVFGLGHYVVLLAWATTGPWGPLWDAAVVAAALWTIVLGAWLTYALLARLRVRCPLCFAAHALNAVLALVVVARLYLSSP